jgi:hypothetical protein
MADLTGINVFLNKDDVNDVSISPVGDGTYELRIGDFIITARSYLELKTLCLNVQSAFEKTLRNRQDTHNVITGILECFKAGAR